MTVVTEITRRKILDFISLKGIDWCGRLNDVEFLSRIYDLSTMQSTDHRYQTAGQDIFQHRIAWSDWPEDWIFHDQRFNFLHGSDEGFLRFIAEMIHPVVRASAAEAREMATEFNKHLRSDGWSLAETASISEHPIFTPTPIGIRHTAVAEMTGWSKVDRQIQEARLRLGSASTEEQFQAVGLLCREALITVAQEAFSPARHLDPNQPHPSATDAARMLEAVFAKELAGSANEEARAHGKASLKLALALQHHRNASYKMAALCLEGAASVTNLVSILMGRH